MHSFKILLSVVAIAAVVVARPESSKEIQHGKRLIKVSEHLPGMWMTQKQILSLVEKNVGFMDITNRKLPAVNSHSFALKEFPTSVKFNSTVQAGIAKLNSSRIESFVTEFSSFPNRYYNNQNGVDAATWLRSQLNSIVSANANYNGSVQVGRFDHTWLQPSTIVRIAGTEQDFVIIGSHMDSIQSGNPQGPAPGADDNASGSAALVETFRAILETGFVPKKTVEFHWYAGEELGLLGSQAIAEEYSRSNVSVTSMLNFDCVGYKSNITNYPIRFRTDYGDIAFTNFLQLATEQYLKRNWTTSECGYGCSDHASWYSFGYSASSPAEPISSPNMHTTRDSLETVDFEMIKEYSKLAVAYLIEIAEPRS